MAQEPNTSITLSGLHAYSDVRSVAPREVIHFHASSDSKYQFSIRRLGSNLDGPGADDVQLYPLVGTTLPREPLVQPIHPGSYIHVENGITGSLSNLTLECWVRPWQLQRTAGVLTQYTYNVACGFGLFVNGDGTPIFFVGNGTTLENGASVVGPALSLRAWVHLVGVYNGATMSLYVNGSLVASKARTGAVVPGTAPLRIGAYGETNASDAGETKRMLDGDVAMPVIYSRALTATEVQTRYTARGGVAPSGSGILAWWKLDEEQGVSVADASGNGHTGTLVNRGTWMIGGPAFDSAAVNLASYNPATDTTRGHGIRFASDDLYDCGWPVTETVTVPDEWTPGIYVGRFELRNASGAVTADPPYDVTFVVRRGPAQAKRQVLVLCATATWLAYNTAPFAGIRVADPYNGISPNPSAPEFSLYFDHHSNAPNTAAAASQPVYQVGLRMPWPSAAPYLRLAVPTDIGYSHLVREERFVHQWLSGAYDFDVATDFDLDADPALLTGYKTVVICGHSEYWTRTAHDRLDAYLTNGGPSGAPGAAIVLAGNVMFWRTSLDLANGIMECRKFPPSLAGANTNATAGEVFHSLDTSHARGGTARECGMPCYSVLGMDSLGTLGTDNAYFFPYQAVSTSHWLFAGANFTNGSYFGYRGSTPRAVGHEFDVRVSTPLMTRNASNVPTDPTGIVTVATCSATVPALTCRNWNGDLVPATSETAVISQIIYWQRPSPSGGQVVYAGSISAGWALDQDQPLQKVVENALTHFGVTKR